MPAWFAAARGFVSRTVAAGRKMFRPPKTAVAQVGGGPPGGRQAVTPEEFLAALSGRGKKEKSGLGMAGALWALDAIKARYDRAAPTYSETVQIHVYGQRWAQVEDLYILAMCVLVDIVDGHLWQGGQGIRCLVNRTEKYVEVEFQQTKQGLAEQAVTLIGANRHPAYYFHQPDWLSNEIKVPNWNRVKERIPDVLTGRTTIIGDELDASIDRNTLIDGGHYTANRVANQTAGSQDGPTLVTHERHVNPAPVADGLSRGTDVTALLAQALHESCDPPPFPETDRQYHVADGPEWGGCNWPVRVDGPQRHGQFKRWWFGFLNASRWIVGWEPMRVPADGHGGQVIDPPRPPDPVPC